MGNISHELKTPMTSIGGFIDGILDGTIPPEKQSHYLGIVSQEIKRLSRMVVSMLNIAKIEAGEMRLNLQAVDLHEIVCRTVLGFENKIEEKHIAINGLDSDKVFIEADPDMIYQVVYNLIENAVKFTPDGGEISIAYKNDGKYVSTSIKNTGEGISKEEISHLFERFYKTDRSRGMDTKGVGLGLHIVKSLINIHDGTIVVKSVQGEYSEFIFTLYALSQKEISALLKKDNIKCRQSINN